jgi:TDG/mug DNA glycosylase family protein
VLESCSREGSSDSSIGDTIPNDIRRFLSDHPSIRCIALNGKTGAGHWFKRYFSDIMNNEDRQVAILPLPSSSPAYAGMSIEKKADIWQQISLFCTKSE